MATTLKCTDHACSAAKSCSIYLADDRFSDNKGDSMKFLGHNRPKDARCCSSYQPVK